MTHAIDDNGRAIQVGDGATFAIWTDRIACTVIGIERNGRTIVLQEDKATLLNGAGSGEPDAIVFEAGGFSGHVRGNQRYEYERDPDGNIIRVSRRQLKSGKVIWKRVGQPTRERGGYAVFGVRRAHYDYNF